MDKLLLHSCCAPCSVYCVDTLRADGTLKKLSEKYFSADVTQ